MKQNDLCQRLVMLSKPRHVTGQDLAKKLVVTQVRISKIGSGVVRPAREFVLNFAEALLLTQGEKGELVALAEHGPWKAGPEDGVEEKKTEAIARMRDGGSEIRSYQLAFAPWFLQSHLYTNQLLTALRYPGGESGVSSRWRWR